MRIVDGPAGALTTPRAAAACFGWSAAVFEGARVAMAGECDGPVLALPYRATADGAEAVLRYQPFVVVGAGRVDRSLRRRLVRAVVAEHGALRLGELNPTVYDDLAGAGRVEVVRSAHTHLALPPPDDVSRLPTRTRRSVARAGRTPWQVAMADGHGRAGAWQLVLEIERASWKHAAGSSILDRPEQLRLYGDLLTRGERGRTFAAIATLDARPAAHVVGVRSGHLAMLMKWSFDEKLRALAPGFHAMWSLLCWLRATGTRVVDFCSNDSTFAAGFANHAMPRRTVVVR